MVFVYFVSRLISSWFAFALPLFRSFQALQRRPLSETDIERLTKYWIVVGALLAFEYSVEAFISWFPFYWELKLLFLLFISLPQVQGSTYIYDTWLSPYLSRNELYLDRQIDSASENFLGFFQAQVQVILDKIMGRTSAGTPGAGPNGATGMQAPSFVADGARLAMSFLMSHGASMAGREDPVRPGASPPASSTSIQPSPSAQAGQRGGFASNSQTSLHITPEDVYQAHSPKTDAHDGAASPAFPQPEHF
ncbi:uncharacterized protein FOMMEDRAFT_167026 [Fomitiporia mediterranea MF3/22]|uniref:uncharacterized protein n=1 Tax=Fomitiporia mediterranea (strain MF3/22) TaxID=694068 RepID=UPI00044076A2|nr:uncharacterized protein FOMMEDRAFT_167026 [Fomitiporia mediterranea MF3/22]EJD03685.1 hypothetical protein FOMMEDRAFT_167026 [Fomitiporia mediterranea MF3/22]